MEEGGCPIKKRRREKSGGGKIKSGRITKISGRLPTTKTRKNGKGMKAWCDRATRAVSRDGDCPKPIGGGRPDPRRQGGTVGGCGVHSERKIPTGKKNDTSCARIRAQLGLPSFLIGDRALAAFIPPLQVRSNNQHNRREEGKDILGARGHSQRKTKKLVWWGSNGGNSSRLGAQRDCTPNGGGRYC